MNKDFRQVIIGIILNSIVINTFSQQAATDKYRLSLAPASPEAAMLFKFSDIPVSKYTGTPNISIPIKRLQSSNNFGLDISLDYHASGNKVSEIPSYVGLGWSLNAGGMISRKTRGLPDDADGLGQSFLELRNNHTYSEISVASEINYTSLSNGCWDAEPDEFFFNVNGYSGSFALDWSVSTNLRINSKFPVKISFFQEIPNSNAITKWELIGPDGYKYIFSALEKTQNKSSYIGLGTCRVTDFYTTSWYLTQIINLNNSSEHIDFSYEGYTLDYDWVFIESMTFGSGGCGCSPISGGGITNSDNRTFVDGLRISQIKFYPSNITADFISTNNRQDLINTYFNLNNKTLDFIQFSYNNGPIIEKYALKYFYQGNRLMLQSIQRFGADNTADNPFEFSYNTTTLPNRDSKSIDSWGYYNGKANATLLPTYVNRLTSTPYYFSGADRSPDVNGSKAQILEKITYPTGGRTEFVYEGHDYAYIQNGTVAALGQYEVVSKSKMTEAIGNGPISTWQTTTVDFHIGQVPENQTVNIGIISASAACQGQDGAFFCGGGGFLPRASIFKFSPITNQYEEIFNYQQPPASAGSVISFAQQEPYQEGDYRLVAEANHSPLNPPNAYDNISINLTWQENSDNLIVQKKAGGLRIKEINSFDNVSSAPKSTKYIYSSDNLSSGVLNGEPVFIDDGHNITDCGLTSVTCPFITLVGSGNIIFGETNGSHIGYREVTAFETGNGKIVTKFKSSYDLPDVINFQKPFGYPASFAYRAGLPSEESIYDETGNLLKKDLFEEYEYSQTDINSIKVGKGDVTCNYSIGGGTFVTECPWDPNNYSGYYASWSEPLRMGFSQLKKQSTFQDGLWVEKDFTYDANHQLLKQDIFKNKDLSTNVITTSYKYPGDEDQMTNLTSDQLNGIVALKNQNRYSVNLEKTIQRDDKVISQIRSNFKTFGNGQTNLESIAESIKNQPLEKRLQINAYDNSGNILVQNKVDDQSYSYLWGYSGMHVIAQALNAGFDDIAYSSFEENSNGTGNWNNYVGTITTVTPDALRSNVPPTGNKYYNLTPTSILSKTVTNGNKYTISYWSKSGVYTINGGNGTYKTGRTLNGWTYYEHAITASSTTLTISGTGAIDEVRLYPNGAQMATYTYDPLIGLTSQCDVNNRISYYEYDGLGRLTLVRDQDKNIIKKICYNYLGQAENCN